MPPVPPPAPEAGEPARPPVVTDLANHLRAAESLRNAYLETGDAVTLRLALEVSKLAVESALPEERVGRAIALGIRCMLLRMAYERDKDPAKLAEAISAGRVAIDVFPPDDAGYPQALASLGNALQEEFGRARDTAVLTEALGMYREALRVLPEGHPEVPAMLSSIGTVLMTQGMQAENGALLDEAVQAGRDAVAASTPGSPAHATRLASLGRALIARYAHRGWPASELDDAERLFTEALDSLPAAHPLRAQIQNYLAGVTSLRG
jgi:hypothetical protein